MKNDYKERVLKRIDDATEIEYSPGRIYGTDNGLLIRPEYVKYLNIIVPLSEADINEIVDFIEARYYQFKKEQEERILSEL